MFRNIGERLNLSNLRLVFVVLVFAITLGVYGYVLSQTKYPSGIGILTSDNAEFEVSGNADFLIFWGVLFFTCVVGIIELLPLLNSQQTKQLSLKTPLSLIYFGLLSGIVLSMSRSWDIVRENYEIMHSGKLGADFSTYITSNPSIFDNPLFMNLLSERIFILLVVIVFDLIFCARIGLLGHNSPEQNKKTEKEGEPKGGNSKRTFMLSERMYLVILLAGLGIFIAFDLIYLIPNVRDIGVNLLTDAAFTAFTIIFLMWLISYRENQQWKLVKEKVLKRTSREIQAIFNLVTYFIDIEDLKELKALLEHPKGNLIKEVFFAKLQALNDSKEIRLDVKGRSLLLDGRYLETFETRRHYLNEIETKYSKFMEPAFVISLMEIQNDLQGITIDVNELLRSKAYEEYAELLLNKIAMKMHAIIKEIYKVHTMGIEIHSEL